MGVKSYYTDAVYLHRWVALRWCLDSPCGGSIILVYYTTGMVNLMSATRVADKSLARPVRKQATATEDFDVHISYL